MNFSVVIICRNEAHNIPELGKCLEAFRKDGGEVVVLDTGSTDNSVELCERNGWIVSKVDENKHVRCLSLQDIDKIPNKLGRHLHEGDRIFDFSGARNEAHTHASNDFIMCLDCTDRLTHFNYRLISQKIAGGTIGFTYYMRFDNKKQIISRIYDRKKTFWVGRVHETPVNQDGGKHLRLEEDELSIRHDWQEVDKSKKRNYLGGLLMDLADGCKNEWLYFNIGRELIAMDLYDQALSLLTKAPSTSCREIDSNILCLRGYCYRDNKKVILRAAEMFLRAYDKSPERREPLIALAQMYDSICENYICGPEGAIDSFYLSNARKVVGFASMSLTIPHGLSYSIENESNYTTLPQYYLNRGYRRLGMFDMASKHQNIVEPTYLHMRPHGLCGMFSSVFSILGALKHFESRKHNIQGVKVDYGCSGAYYESSHGPNWWNYYFEPVNLVSCESERHTYKCVDVGNDWGSISLAAESEFGNSRKENARLFGKYFVIKSHVQRVIQGIYDENNFKEIKTIGVHYRGTEKKIEAQRIDYDVFIYEMKSKLKDYETFQIFVATDEYDFLDFIRSSFPASKIFFQEMKRSPANGSPLFNQPNDGFNNGLTALVDCMVLSRCDFLFRTSSNLSAMSTIANPDLEYMIVM